MMKPNWQAQRQTKLSKITWPKTQRGWLNRWKKTLKVVEKKATDLWADREDYNEYREIVLSNPTLDKTAGFFHLVDRMYLSHVLIAIRTFDDPDLRSLSLHNLLEEIRDNASRLTEAWFVNRFRGMRKEGIRQFREHWGGGSHVKPHRVDADIRLLLKLCRRVRHAANKHLAHNARRRQMKPLTYREIDTAIDGIFRLVSRYNALIYNASLGPPNVLSSSHIFTTAWST